MKYTLDSKELIENALLNEFKGAKIYSVPVIKSGLELKELIAKEHTYYFGVMTIGAVADAHFKYRGGATIKGDASSQIIVPFTEVSFKDQALLEVDPEGIFFGFEIQVQR